MITAAVSRLKGARSGRKVGCVGVAEKPDVLIRIELDVPNVVAPSS